MSSWSGAIRDFPCPPVCTTWSDMVDESSQYTLRLTLPTERTTVIFETPWVPQSLQIDESGP